MTDQRRETITPAIRKWLGRANAHGYIVYHGTRGFGHSAWERCMQRAVRLGLVQPNAFNEFEITEAGLKARAQGAKGTGR